MFVIKAYAETRAQRQERIAQRLVGASTGRGAQSAFYRRTGTSGLGATARTRGRTAPIRPVATRGR